MSDKPPETPDADGGWHKPETPGAWREPEQPQDPTAGWRVPAIPRDLEEEMVESGEWHVPNPEDTIFTEEDEIEIGNRPEDELMETSPPDEEEELAPEDLMMLIEEDEEDDDFDTLGMSELVALASLAEEGEDVVTVSASESPIPASMSLPAEEDAEEAEVIADEMLSPAERVIIHATELPATADGVDAAEYARQQMAQLGGASPDPIEMQPTVPGTPAGELDSAEYARQQMAKLSGGAVPAAPIEAQPTSGAAGELDPAEYARQQMAQLSGGAIPAPPIPTGATSVPQPTQPQLTLREQELARKYHEAEAQVRAFRAQMQTGQIGQDVFLAKLRELMVLDDNQVWWMMGVEIDQWYKAENNAWIEATPDALLMEQRLAATSAPSLPYLPDDAPSQPSTGGYTPPGDLQVDSGYMPLPREVPVSDPDYTVPSPAAFNNLGGGTPDYASPTVPAPGISGGAQPTVMAQPIDYNAADSPYDDGSYDPSPYDATDAPDDYDLDQDAPFYEDARDRERASTKRILVIAGIVVTALVFLVAAGFVVTALLWYNGIVDEWETQIAALEDYQPTFQTLTILDTQGNVIATLGDEGNDRRPVDLEQISPYMVHAVISLENKGFYEDPGWDFIRIIKAFWENYTAGEIESGASTITQQVARHLVLQSAEVTADRKLNELVVAGELSRRYDKNFILELYLNEVAFFGNGSYGIEAAAQFYFNKSAAQLTLPESALLASIIRSPAANEPVNNRETAMSLMRVTIERMAQVGCLDFQHIPPFGDQHFCVDPILQDIDQVLGVEEVFTLDMNAVETTDFRPRESNARYPHVVELVRNQLGAVLRSDEIYTGGYIVRTTIDPTLQDAAQRYLVDHVARNTVHNVNTGAVMVTDPRNGAILALIGSPDFYDEANQGQYPYTHAWRQPGSSIKPIVYSAALQGVDKNGNGVLDFGEYMTPASIMWDVETVWHTADGTEYRPANYDRQFHGPTSLRYALQNSYNIPAIKAYDFVGEADFRTTAQSMGLRFADNAIFGLPTSIGSTEVRLYDMMKAYGALANDGALMDLYLIESIVDANGNPIGTPPRQEPTQAISPQVAFLMQHILSDNQARVEQFGPASSLVLAGLPQQDYVAAKTGTTDNGRDLWTLGFTSNRVVGVWMGTHGEETYNNRTGSNTAAPLWNQVMVAALQNEPASQFAPPTGVVSMQICPETGTQFDGASSTCPQPRHEYFVNDHPPLPPNQSMNQVMAVDSWTGLIASEFCPDNVVDANFVSIDDGYAVYWLNTAPEGAQYAESVGIELPVRSVPTTFCEFGSPIPVVNVFEPQGGQTIQSRTEIKGQVSAQNFHRYQIEFAPLTDPENFAMIEGPIYTQYADPNSTLGWWDTTQVENGDYILRLAVFSTDGGYLYRTAMVRVNNPMIVPTNTPPVAPTAAPGALPTPLPFDDLSTPAPSTLPTPTFDIST
jgi:membrane peptidoglycan carboxypeptidase